MAQKLRPPTVEEKWLSFAYAEAIKLKVVTYDQLLARFTPLMIFEALAEEMDRQADMLETCTKLVDREVGKLLDAKTAASMLATSEKARRTSSKEVFETLKFDQFVVFFGGQLVWKYLFQEFRWLDTDAANCKDLVAALMDKIIADDLLKAPGKNTHCEMVFAIGFKAYGRDVPAERNSDVLEAAVRMGERAQGFAAQKLLTLLKPEELVKYMKLTTLEPALVAVAKKYKWLERESSGLNRLPSAVAAFDAADVPIPMGMGKNPPPEVEIEEETRVGTNEGRPSAPTAAGVTSSGAGENEFDNLLDGLEEEADTQPDSPSTSSVSVRPNRRGQLPPPLKSRRENTPPTGELAGLTVETGGPDIPPDLDELRRQARVNPSLPSERYMPMSAPVAGEVLADHQGSPPKPSRTPTGSHPVGK